MPRRNYNRHNEPGSKKTYDWNGEGDFPPRLYMSTYAEWSGELGEEFDTIQHNQYGWTLIPNFYNVQVEDGILYEKRQEGEIKELKYKLFAVEECGLSEDDITSCETGEELHEKIVNAGFEIMTQSPPSGTEQFDLVGGRAIIDDEAEVAVEFGDITLDVARVYFGTGNNGPKSSSKRAVRLLAENGRDDLISDGTKADGRPSYPISGWFANPIQPAEELVGDRLRFWETKEDIEGQSHKYNHLYAEWQANGKELPVRTAGENNTSVSDETNEAMTALADGSGNAQSESAPAPTFSDSTKEAVQFFINNGITDEETIRTRLQTAAENEIFPAEEFAGNEDYLVQAAQGDGL